MPREGNPLAGGFRERADEHRIDSTPKSLASTDRVDIVAAAWLQTECLRGAHHPRLREPAGFPPAARHGPPTPTRDARKLRGDPMKNLPGISVVIPCFNQGSFLAEAIDSVLAQSHDGFEI